MEQKVPTIQKNLEKSKKELEQATGLEKNSSEQVKFIEGENNYKEVLSKNKPFVK